MSTLRVSNIEAKADVSSPSVNEKVKITNSNGELLVHIDGATSGITTVGINTSGESVRFDSNQNVTFFGDITGTGLDINGNTDISGNLKVGGVLTYEDVTNIDSVGIITAQAGIRVTGGSVGIGTDSPTNTLEISKVDNHGITLTRPAGGSNPGTVKFEVHSNGSGRLISERDFNLNFDTDNVGNQNFSVSANGSERLRITSGGTLESYSPDDTTPNIKFRSNDTNWFGSLNQSVEGGTITSFLSCGGDWSADGTTYSATKALAAYPTSAIAIHNQYNSTWGSEFVFLTKAGGSSTTDGSVTERLRITSTGLLDVSGGIHVTENVTPTSGRGVEIFEAATGVGQISSYNRNANSWDELKLKGSEVRIHTGSTNALTLDLQKSASTLYGTSDGMLNLDTTDTRGSFIRFKQNGAAHARVGCAHGFTTSGFDKEDLGLQSQTGNIVFLNNGSTERMRIHSNGAVTKPTNPSFLARLSNTINIATNGNSDVVFNDEYFDNGNNYNTSNGRFTAPIAGKYFFGVQLYVGFSVTAVRVMHAKFSKNGNVYAGADMFGGINADGGTHYHPTGCATSMIDLAANDYVTFNLGSLSTTGSGQALLYASNGTRFFGYLVG